jgi:hypothetical protein
VLEGGVDAENACQPVRTITRLVQRSRNGEERGYLAPVAGMCSQERIFFIFLATRQRALACRMHLELAV